MKELLFTLVNQGTLLPDWAAVTPLLLRSMRSRVAFQRDSAG